MDYQLFLQGINRKEEQSWMQLYDYFYASLCCYSRRIVNNPAAAEDTVQSVLVKLWQSDQRFGEMKILVGYLYRSVYNASLNYVRSQHRSMKLDRTWVDSLDEDENIGQAIEEEVLSRLYAAIAKLPEQQRYIITKSLEGEKVKDIAATLGISENTVKTHKKRAYLSIREDLGNLWEVFAWFFMI